MTERLQTHHHRQVTSVVKTPPMRGPVMAPIYFQWHQSLPFIPRCGRLLRKQRRQGRTRRGLRRHSNVSSAVWCEVRGGGGLPRLTLVERDGSGDDSQNANVTTSQTNASNSCM